jgi:phospho-N-acetylmuramoyl-pentapeptide-transferase
MIVCCWESLVGLLGSLVGEQLPSAAVRAALAAACSCLLALLFGPPSIRWLGLRFGERVASPSADIQRLHAHKSATPTMGGLFIISAILLSMAFFADWRNCYVYLAAFVLIGFAAVGCFDDLKKLSAARRGLSASAKLLGQLAVGSIAALALYGMPNAIGAENPSATGDPAVFIASSALAAAGMLVLVVVASSNAVNLTDGLDGLAGGCLAPAFAVLGIVACLRGDPAWSEFFQVSPSPGAGEMAVVAAAACGAVVGFLWFNTHPAAVFMGDTGALSLGALLGLVAVAAQAEMLLLLIGGVFVLETLSVILQVASFRMTGRRIFLCAPLHHHFQLRGWTEHKIVARFWIAAALCGAAGLLAVAATTNVGQSGPSPLAVARRGG